MKFKKILRRILAPVLALVLFMGMITGTAPKAAAADFTDKAGWVDLLDYGAFPESRTFEISGYITFNLPLPYDMSLACVDILFVSTGTISSASCSNGVSGAELDVYSLGSGLYRLCGSVQEAVYSSIYLSIISPSSTVTILSFLVSAVESVVTPEIGYIYYQDRIVSEMTTPDSPIGYQGYSTAVQVDTVRYNVRYWYKYDCIQIAFRVICHDILGVSASVGDYNLPVDMTYLQNDDSTVSDYYVIATIDLTGVSRDLSYDLSLQVRCGVRTNQFDMYLYQVLGFTYVEPPSPLAYWFTSLFSNLGNWFSSVVNTVSTGLSNVGNWLSSGFQSVVNKLDVLVNGGEGGEELVAGGEELKDQTGSMKDNVSQIQGFEDQYFGELEAGMGDVISGASISMLVAPLSFIHTYINKIVAGVPSAYLVVFTLPMLLGIFMYIVGHPVRAPRPDTSGDQVTRETFTTTTVLSGRNAGQSTTTRTVTTSQEIGRVHRE